MTPKFILISLVTLFLFLSCGYREQPVTQKEAMNAARLIDSSISNKKTAVFNQLLNETMLARRVARDANIKMTTALIKGVKDGIINDGLADQLIRSTMDDGFYQLVKQYEQHGTQHLLFRLYSNEGLNYHDFELAKHDGQTYIADIYIYSAGANFSSLISDFVKTMLDPNLKLSESEKDGTINMIRKIRRLMKEDKYQDAQNIFDRIPVEIQGQKSFCMIGIELSSQLDVDAYLRNLDDFKKRFPNDPGNHLLLIDAFFLREQYRQALESIERLDALIDKDPFMDYLRALIFKLLKKPVESRKYLLTLNENFPFFEDSAIELIANYLDAKEYVQARSLIKKYHQNIKFDQQTLSLVLDEYDEFDQENDSPP